MAQEEKLPAFPGAEGFGRYVTGGRGGKVYHVTNLDDSGTGSLRWAIGQSGSKTIVFDVSGTIHLKSELKIGNNTTIAGQTAPGDGICVADYPCSIQGNNVIVRYMRFRLGNKNIKVNGADGWDGFGGFDHKDWMIDHCSVSWSADECLSVLGNINTTVQWCLVAQSLRVSGHTKGAHGYGGNWGGSGASFHHNLMVHHESRTPRLGPRPTTQMDERMDMRNNVIYNWASLGCYGGEAMNVNIVNNYYKPGPGTATRNANIQKRIAGIGIRTDEYVQTYPAYAPAHHIWGKYYVDGNVNPKYSDVTNDNWTYGIYNQISNSDNDNLYTQKTKDTIKLDQPINFILTTTHTAEKAYEKVLDYVGCSKSRDSFDALMVSDTRNGVATYTGDLYNLTKNSDGTYTATLVTGQKYGVPGVVNSQDDNKPADAGSDWSAWPTLNSTTAPVDSDGDGMPDEWEDAHGLNKNDATDGNLAGEGGYTNVEIYLNSLVADITAAQNEGGTQQGSIETKPAVIGTDEEGKRTLATGDVKWPFNTGSTGQTAEYGDDVRPYLGTNSVSVGSTLKYNNQRKLNDNIYATMFRPSIKNEATANNDNAVNFTFNVPEGKYFRPTKVALIAARVATDGGKINISISNAQGALELESALSPERANAYSSLSYDVNQLPSASGDCTVSVNIYNLDSAKDIALANITVTGEVKEDDTDGIGEIQTKTLLQGATYNLQGMRVENPQKGIYIQNGKKKIIK